MKTAAKILSAVIFGAALTARGQEPFSPVQEEKHIGISSHSATFPSKTMGDMRITIKDTLWESDARTPIHQAPDSGEDNVYSAFNEFSPKHLLKASLHVFDDYIAKFEHFVTVGPERGKLNIHIDADGYDPAKVADKNDAARALEQLREMREELTADYFRELLKKAIPEEQIIEGPIKYDAVETIFNWKGPKDGLILQEALKLKDSPSYIRRTEGWDDLGRTTTEIVKKEGKLVRIITIKEYPDSVSITNKIGRITEQ